VNPPGLSFDVLTAYTRGETRRWYEWFTTHPADTLDVPVGEGRTATVRGLLVHIFAVELRYAERLLGQRPTPYEELPASSIEEIFAIGGRAAEKLERYLDAATEEDLHRMLTFETVTMGTLSASKQRIVSHSFVHGIRHWAQIATALRQAGHGDQWPHDVLFAEGTD
jgi:uncharacterized damage-inducible protein DinB